MNAKRMTRMLLSLLLVFCMLLSFVPATALTALAAENTVIYVSVGDSMTNGYCLDGYDGTSGAINYGSNTYSNMFAAYLAGYNGNIADDQVIFTGSKGTVDHRQLALSGMRAQDIQWVLELNYKDADLINTVYNNRNGYTSWNSNTWYTHSTAGDRYTWSELTDAGYRYADAAARILATYTGDNDSYFTSSYADQAAIDNAISGIASDPAYPTRDNVTQIGGSKYLQIATEYYQKSIADADVISLAVGNTNFGTHMLSSITDVLMKNKYTFSQNYSIEKAMELANLDSFAKQKVDAMLASDAYAQIETYCAMMAGDNAQAKEEIKYIVKYCTISFITGYIGMLNNILELNPDADIIMIALMNAYEEQNGTVADGTLGQLVDVIYTPMNQFLKTLPTELLNSKTDATAYKNANFYFAEAPYVSCMVDVFGDDYYTSNGSYVNYPGLLTGNEGYEANEGSIVRARFVEEIVCGDLLFAAMGMQKDESVIPEFLEGVIAYDMMTETEKGAFAAQDADAAKEYALYLAFENALIRSGTQNVTMEALAGLATIQTVFEQKYPVITAAIGAARKNHYASAAAVVAAGSDGALTTEQVVEILNAYETMKAKVWEGFADYHTTLADLSHPNIEYVIQCDSCMNGDAHGNQLLQQVAATYKEQLDLLPYTIVAETIKDQTGGFLDGEDVRTLCKTTDSGAYKTAVYGIVKAKSTDLGYSLEDGDIDLLREEDGEFKLAAKIVNESGTFGFTVTAEMVKSLYTGGSLDAEYIEKIDMLKRVRAGVETLLNSETTLKTSAAGVAKAIDAGTQLAYLLALPQTMSDEMYNDTNLRGALTMNARCVLGTGAGGHPSVDGHRALYNAVLKVYDNACIMGHSYEAEWTWADDYSSASVILTCETCTDTQGEAVTATVTSVTTDATCAADGKTVYTATVTIDGETYQDTREATIPMLEHTAYTAATPVWAEDYSSCSITFTCECTHTETVTDNTITSEVIEEATCEKTGEIKYTADFSGSELVEEAVTTTATTPALTHDWNDGEVTTEPGCETTGVKTFTCARGCTKTETVDALDHNWDEGKITKEPTETETGIKTYTCKREGCGETKEETIPTLEHTHSHTAVVTAPTCTEKGYTTYTCDCGDSYTDDEVPALEHSWNEGEVTKEPTETETGIKTFTCKREGCGETKEETIPVKEPDHTHSYKEVVTAPTCEEDGYTTYTCDCGDTYIDDEVPALGHTEETVERKEATCTVDGHEEGTRCTVCGETLSGMAAIPAVGHKSETLEGKDPTCTEDGLTDGVVCTICETVLTEQKVIPALGHDYEDGVCTVCGVKESSVSRLSGANRYSTAFNAANAMKEVLGVETFDNIVVAYGQNFADALAGSYLANELDAPILLTEDSFQADVIDYIAENLSEDGKVYILGGTSSVSASFEEDLEDADISCERLSGDNRYLTNLEILTEAGLNGKTILVCDGNNFADSLSASSLDLPILLVGSSLSKDQKDYLDTLDDVSFRIIGGVNSVSEAIAEALEAYGTVERISGETREETSVKVAEAFFSSPETALIAYSRNFPDGLCGGPLAYQLGAPLILVNSGAESFAADYVADNEITSGIILGGTSSIPDDVANAVFPQ